MKFLKTVFEWTVILTAITLLAIGLVLSELALKMQKASGVKTKPKKDDLQIHKYRRLYADRKDYYLTMAVNNPDVLAQSLANADLRRFERMRQIDKLYSALHLKTLNN